MSRKAIILAMTAAVVAMAIPGVTSAAWKHHNTAIQKNVTLELLGEPTFASSLGGVRCQIKSAALFEANTTTGKLETFTAHPTSDTANCQGIAGFAFCQIHNLQPQHNVNWSFKTGIASVEITTGTLSAQLTGGFCPATKIELTKGTIFANPDQQTTVSNVTLTGALAAHVQTDNGMVDQVVAQVHNTSAQLTIEAPNKKTYSI